MIKMVVDTNVFVSSFFGGNPRKVIDLWKSGKVTICLSPAIIEEYVEVLKRLGLDGERELEELLHLFSHGYHILFTAKTPRLFVVEDPADNKFMECAVALKADFVVSGDKKVLKVENYMGIKIITTREFLKTVAKVD